MTTKLTKQQLKKLVKEEVKKQVLKESKRPIAWFNNEVPLSTILEKIKGRNPDQIKIWVEDGMIFVSAM